MHRVAAKVPQEVAMLFEYDDLDAGACQQNAKHHSRGATTSDAAAGVNGIASHVGGHLLAREGFQGAFEIAGRVVVGRPQP